jgi:hypothetical protein
VWYGKTLTPKHPVNMGIPNTYYLNFVRSGKYSKALMKLVPVHPLLSMEWLNGKTLRLNVTITG